MLRPILGILGLLVILPILLLAIACGEEPATDAPAQAAPAASGSSPAQVAPTAPAASGSSPAQKSATTAVSPAATPAVSGAARPAVKTGIVTTSNIVADWVQAVGRTGWTSSPCCRPTPTRTRSSPAQGTSPGSPTPDWS